MKLGVVARTVVVASCFWMVGGTFFFTNDIYVEAEKAATTSYRQCARIVGELHCSAVWGQVYHARTDGIQFGPLGFGAVEAAIWLVLALILFGAIYGSARWILAARRPR